ncbi:MAG: adenylyltransferase/cytidyltransferase family protein [Firmicutes bacterium]|nr:adenylyltransferase/cytidyltransferase family protein [Bacillota bacterium]
MEIIGVTGLSGVGKTEYCRRLASDGGFFVCEVDKLVYATLDNPDFITRAQKLLNATWSNRRELGEIVFSKPRETIDQYNLLIWSYVEPQIDTAIELARTNGTGILIEYLFLNITKFWDMCTKRVLVTRADGERKRAAARRDSVSIEYIEKRDAAFPFVFDEADFDEVIRVEHRTTAFFAGSFDPFTNGHLAVARAALELYDDLVIGIGINPNKTRAFDRDKMRAAIHETIDTKCIIYDGMTGDAAREHGAAILVRGRGNDEYEQTMAKFNRENFDLDTVFFETGMDICSSKIKKMARDEILGLVPPPVLKLMYGNTAD